MAGYCCDSDKALKVYKNYPTEFADVDWLSILFESEAIDLTNFNAQFILGDAHREWTDLTQRITINLSEEETSALPVGLNYGTLIVTDTSGNSKPFTTAIPVEVLTWVEGDQEIDTYNMTVNALLDNETQMVIKIETAKVSLVWVLEKIAEHNASEEAHPYIRGLIDDEIFARESADNGLSNRITEESNTREISDNYLSDQIDLKQDKLTSEQVSAVNSGITIQKVSLYDSHVANNVIHVTAQDKNNWNNKQNYIQDLDIIRENAQSGKQASQTISGYGNIVTHNVSEFASASQGIKADSALQPTDVINNTSSEIVDKPLSANMGKSLQDQIDNLKARGRFLALWNCATGLAESNPPSGTYIYQSGDYFIIGVVAQAGGTNYKPDGSSYTTGVSSTVIETQPVDTDDVYYYDGNVWRLQVNTQKEIGFVNIAGSPYDNTSLSSALNSKQDEITAQNKLSSDLVDDTNHTNKFTTTQEKATWNGKQDAINDLDTIRSGASAGATALQGVQVNGTNLTPDANKKVNVQVPTDTSDLTNGAGFITSSALSDYVTTNTKQMMTAPKAITGTDVPWGSDQVQKNLFMAVSNSNTTPVVEWIGRSMFGANNLTFLMGTINKMAALGAHSWTSAKDGTGAAWADIYINPDGDKAVKIGGSPMVGRPSIMVIQNMGQTTTGTVKINRRPLLTQSALYKDVACWDDNVSKFNNDAGYITLSALSGYATQAWVGQQGYITSSALSGYQTTSNLVTSVSSSSTDSQYPSAKLLYDICGDIEATINAIRGV